jgi:F-type H+-transporting ATPase subunit delta
MSIARPYVAAAFEYAAEKKDISKWESMLDAAALTAANPAVMALMQNPETSAEQLAEFFCDILKKLLDKHKTNFIRLLAEKNRLAELPAIAELFKVARAEAEQMLTVQVTSAEPLKKAYQDKLVKALSKRLSRTVELQCEVDETLLGGVIVRAGDLVIDGSIRGKLSRLNNFI